LLGESREKELGQTNLASCKALGKRAAFEIGAATLDSRTTGQDAAP